MRRADRRRRDRRRPCAGRDGSRRCHTAGRGATVGGELLDVYPAVLTIDYSKPIDPNDYEWLISALCQASGHDAKTSALYVECDDLGPSSSRSKFWPEPFLTWERVCRRPPVQLGKDVPHQPRSTRAQALSNMLARRYRARATHDSHLSVMVAVQRALEAMPVPDRDSARGRRRSFHGARPACTRATSG